MKHRIALAIVLAALIAGCTQTDTTTKPTWITPTIIGEEVSFPVEDVLNNHIVHVRVSQGDAVMAYEVQGNIFVRASECPPCQNEEFALDGNNLVCTSCGSKFDAFTGEGVSGPNMNYYKERIHYFKSNGDIVMQLSDIKEAHRATIKPD